MDQYERRAGQRLETYLMLSQMEDNEGTVSQAFSCFSVVSKVYTCAFAHVSATQTRLCFCPQLVCFGYGKGGVGAGGGHRGESFERRAH